MFRATCCFGGRKMTPPLLPSSPPSLYLLKTSARRQLELEHDLHYMTMMLADMPGFIECTIGYAGNHRTSGITGVVIHIEEARRRTLTRFIDMFVPARLVWYTVVYTCSSAQRELDKCLWNCHPL